MMKSYRHKLKRYQVTHEAALAAHDLIVGAAARKAMVEVKTTPTHGRADSADRGGLGTPGRPALQTRESAWSIQVTEQLVQRQCGESRAAPGTANRHLAVGRGRAGILRDGEHTLHQEVAYCPSCARASAHRSLELRLQRLHQDLRTSITLTSNQGGPPAPGWFRTAPLRPHDDRHTAGKSFVTMLNAIHAGTSGRSLANGFLSATLQITCGIRQVAIGVLDRQVEGHGGIRGLTLSNKNGEQELRIAGYADDTTLYLHDDSMLKQGVELFEDFRGVSGLRVNVKKPVLLPLGPTATRSSKSAATGMPALEQGSTCRYLGVQVDSGNTEAAN
ncbi:hypothetical protein PybrP1_010612 [[Pythium] brassicae (nom. inval.)]|nr:hypothetical protein PybrP1_010612 [[Pythium] brassicae (nom. inval.)]